MSEGLKPNEQVRDLEDDEGSGSAGESFDVLAQRLVERGNNVAEQSRAAFLSKPDQWKQAQDFNNTKLESYIDLRTREYFVREKADGLLINKSQLGDKEKVQKIVDSLLSGGIYDFSGDSIDKSSVKADKEYNADQKQFGGFSFISGRDGDRLLVDHESFEAILEKAEEILDQKDTLEEFYDSADLYDDEPIPRQPANVLDLNSVFESKNSNESAKAVGLFDSLFKSSKVENTAHVQPAGIMSLFDVATKTAARLEVSIPASTHEPSPTPAESTTGQTFDIFSAFGIGNSSEIEQGDKSATDQQEEVTPPLPIEESLSGKSVTFLEGTPLGQPETDNIGTSPEETLRGEGPQGDTEELDGNQIDSLKTSPEGTLLGNSLDEDPGGMLQEAAIGTAPEVSIKAESAGDETAEATVLDTSQDTISRAKDSTKKTPQKRTAPKPTVFNIANSNQPAEHKTTPARTEQGQTGTETTILAKIDDILKAVRSTEAATIDQVGELNTADAAATEAITTPTRGKQTDAGHKDGAEAIIKAVKIDQAITPAPAKLDKAPVEPTESIVINEPVTTQDATNIGQPHNQLPQKQEQREEYDNLPLEDTTAAFETIQSKAIEEAQVTQTKGEATPSKPAQEVIRAKPAPKLIKQKTVKKATQVAKPLQREDRPEPEEEQEFEEKPVEMATTPVVRQTQSRVVKNSAQPSKTVQKSAPKKAEAPTIHSKDVPLKAESNRDIADETTTNAHQEQEWITIEQTATANKIFERPTIYRESVSAVNSREAVAENSRHIESEALIMENLRTAEGERAHEYKNTKTQGYNNGKRRQSRAEQGKRHANFSSNGLRFDLDEFFATQQNGNNAQTVRQAA